ncbi:MAG TPA: rhomboid family intramembrane serine protease [Paludibacteraceae bacterium]|nr:rhomboid family intramembrane serine protease [Paludibacteraceae bacterium]HRS67014.1 rhomboid family intramembrane serine protease [Paludibacteraceae bacterium]
MPASWKTLLYRPWSIITYMFLHFNLFHLFFNMLCLYWFGKLFLNFFSQKQLVGLYILGGMGGALLYLLAYNSFPYFASIVNSSYLLGASASIMAIIVALATTSPNYTIRLMLIGDIHMKYFAGITVLISVLSVTGSNAGGEFAHLGGALVGFLYAYFMKKGTDLTSPINRIIDWFINLQKYRAEIRITKSFQPKTTKTDAEYNQTRAQQEKEIDSILDKIKQSGYDSLTASEKQRLFDRSQSL